VEQRLLCVNQLTPGVDLLEVVMKPGLLDSRLQLRDQRRRFYRITPDGRKALGAEVSRLEELIRLARRSRGVPRSVRR